jgi:uncharacterized membrane protein
MIKIDTIKPELIFLFFCLIFGSIFAVISFPFFVPDEESHFYKSFDISQGHIVPESSIITIPNGTHSIVHNYSHMDMSNFKKTKYISDLNKHLNVNNKEKLNIPNIYNYAPVPYLAVAFVIKIGGFFELSPLILMYFGRLINLLIYCIIVYYAIKIIPIQKYSLLLIALIPNTLYEAASLSADSFNIAISFFTIALFLNLALTQTKIQKKEIFLLSISIICLMLSKQIYALIVLLFFIIPKYKFESMKKRIIYFIYIILPASIAIISWNYLFKTYTLITTPLSSSNSLLTNPMNFLTILVNTLIYFNGYINEFVTWMPLPKKLPLLLPKSIPSFLICLYLIILIIVSTLNINNFKLKLKQKTISLMIFLLCSMVIFLLAYGWIPLGSPIILGVQGRYFTPIAPLLFLIFYNNSEKISKYFGKKYLSYLNVFVIASIVIMLSISTYILYGTSICSMFIH